LQEHFDLSWDVKEVEGTIDQVMGDLSVGIGEVKPDHMLFTFVLLGRPDRVPDHLNMLQASREPWDTGFLYRGINKPIVHEEFCHSASDNAKEESCPLR